MRSIIQKIVLLIVVLASSSMNAQPHQSSVGKKLRIALVTLSTPDRHLFTQYTIESFKKYAAKWGYALHTFSELFDASRSPQWNKIKAAEHMLTEHTYDWIVWLDDDLFITNPSIPLENFIEEYGQQKDFIITNLNSGIFLVKNTAWSKQFLQKVWEIGKHRYQKGMRNEEGAIGELMNVEEFARFIAAVPTRKLQSSLLMHFKGDDGTETWHPGDFAAHALGTPNNVRYELFSQLAQKPDQLPVLPEPICQLYTVDPNFDVTTPTAYYFASTNKNHNRIALITFSTPGKGYPCINGYYALYTINAMKQYAERWGYDLYIHYGPLDSSRAQSWTKIEALTSYLAKNYDWCLWISDSVFITNPTISLEQHIQHHGTNTDIIMSAHKQKPTPYDANSDLILAKNTSNTQNFLQQVWDVGTHTYAQKNQGEQEVIKILLQTNIFNNTIKVVPARQIQSFITLLSKGDMVDCGQWQPGDFAAHLRGEEEHDRFWRIILYKQFDENGLTYPTLPTEFNHLTIQQELMI